LEEGLQTEKTTPYLKNESVIPLTKNLFDKDALVFKNLKSKSISLKSKINKHSITMDISGYPFLGIWSKLGTDKFVCIEPWQGIADTKGKNAEFKNKEGIIQLDPFTEFACQYTLTIV
jgi:galactose mutarotase-like enzyme